MKPATIMEITRLQRMHHGSRRMRGLGAAAGTALMALAAAYSLFPVAWLAVAATKDGAQLYNTPMFAFPRHFHFLGNLRAALRFNHGIFAVWCLNSAIYSSVTAALSCLFSALCGYSLAKFRFRLRGMFFSLVLVSLLLPSAALALPTFLIVKNMGLINTYPGVILPMIASPFGAYFMKVYADGAIPDALLDSARVEGAGEWRIFWRIALPIIRPGVAALFLIAFVSSWNNFLLPLLILSSARLFPLTLGLRIFPETIMGSFLSILPTIALFAFLGRSISAGALSDGLKI